MDVNDRTGAISRTDLDQTFREIGRLVDEAREAGWDDDASGEHCALQAARSQLADLDAQLADRMEELVLEHGHRPGFTTEGG